jgi:hypothetical protein
VFLLICNSCTRVGGEVEGYFWCDISIYVLCLIPSLLKLCPNDFLHT